MSQTAAENRGWYFFYAKDALSQAVEADPDQAVLAVSRLTGKTIPLLVFKTQAADFLKASAPGSWTLQAIFFNLEDDSRSLQFIWLHHL